MSLVEPNGRKMHSNNRDHGLAFSSVPRDYLSLRSWNNIINTHQMKNRIMSVVIDEALMVGLSSFLHSTVIRSFLLSTHSSIQKRFRIESFALLRNVANLDARSRRLQLNSVLQTSMHLKEFESILRSNMGYRVIYTCISATYASLLSRGGFDSIGNLFAFIRLGVADKSKSQWVIMCVMSLLKSILSYHLFDIIMFVIRFLLRGYLLSSATTEEEKMLRKYMSQESVEEFTQYCFDNNAHETFHDYLMFITDIMSGVVDQISEIRSGSVQEESQSELTEKDSVPEEKSDIDRLYLKMGTVFRECLQVLDKSIAWAKENNAFHIIQERSVKDVYETLSQMRSVTTSLLQRYHARRATTGIHLSKQIVDNIHNALNGKASPSTSSDTALFEKLDQCLTELQQHSRLIESSLKEPLQIPLLPFHKAEYSIDTAVSLMELPLRLCCVVITDLLVSQSFGIETMNEVDDNHQVEQI